MPTISETVTIPSATDEVWPLLSDPTLVAACIPGATLSPDREGDAWKGSIRVKFGPTVAIFKGEATLTYDHTQRTCTIAGRGIDGRGASRALANGLVTVNGQETTTLKVDGEYSVTGPLETFANAGGVHVARALLAEFSANMAKMVAERRGGGASPAPTAVAAGGTPRVSAAGSNVTDIPPTGAPKPPLVAAAELSAVKLIWAAFLSWLRTLFGKRT